MALEPGSTFAGFLIERRLGVGGMGAVYLVRHPRLPRRDALKVLDAGLGADQAFRARFEREAELTARLDHPNIVSIHDRGIEGDQLWISMRYVDGTDAAGLIHRFPGGLPPDRAVHITVEAGKGLDHAHRHGLLHRDVKPANLLIATDSEGDHVYVTDFGIARTLDGSTALTSTGSFLATIAYAAPELIEGKPIDHRIDVYALGCTLFEMLTGRVPFERPNPVAVMHAHLSTAPPAVSERNPSVPAALDAVIARAMAKNPADRFQSCRELAAAAQAALVPERRIAPTVQRQVHTPAPPTVVRPGPPAFASGPRPVTPQPRNPTPPPQQFVPPQQPTGVPQPVPVQRFAGSGPVASPRPPAKPKIGTGAIIAGVIAALVVFIVVVVALVVASNKGGTKSGVNSAPPVTDEEAVESAIRATYATIVSDGIEASLPMFCDASQTVLQTAIDAGGFDSFVVGEYDITVDSIEDISVDGDTASATSTTTTTGLGDDFDGTETTVEDLVKVDGEWKLCWDL